MSKRGQVVNRPLKKSEYTIVFAALAASKGWEAMLATRRNEVVAAWEFLTSTPLQQTRTNYRLRDQLSHVARGSKRYEQWQHKLGGGARIWFYVDGQRVYLTDVSTHHPNETK